MYVYIRSSPLALWRAHSMSSMLLIGVSQIVKNAAGDFDVKNGRNTMATASDTPLESHALLNCPKNDKTVTDRYHRVDTVS